MIVGERTFRQFVSRARKLWPLDHPVRVVRVPHITDCVGSCTFDGERYLIEVWRGMCRQATVETLLHEWAHALLHEHENPNWSGHDDDFWRVYGQLYRSWYRVPAVDT